MDNFYFYNTDSGSIVGPPRFHILISQRLAVTGGPRRFGEQLGQLAPGNTLLMNEDSIGVVAVGTVLERWDRKGHRDPLYYIPGVEFGKLEHEYRIKVNWFLDLSDKPISVRELKERLGYTPRGAVRKIVKWRAVIEKMIDERRGAGRSNPQQRKLWSLPELARGYSDHKYFNSGGIAVLSNVP